MNSLLSFFKNKKILITGHTGFKGSWLANLLLDAGADVYGYALPPSTTPNLFSLLNLTERCHNTFSDINDLKSVSDFFTTVCPEIVFHLAAQPLVHLSYLEPIQTISTNVIGTANILHAIKESNSVRSAVIITSDKCYQNNGWPWGYREIDQLGGDDPYSASKAAAEIIFSSFYQSYFRNNPQLGIATARAGNVIGGGDWSSNRIIPDCIRSFVLDQPVLIRSPHSTRPWQHVLDPLSGYLTLAHRLYIEPHFNEGSWNFGPASSTHLTVLTVAQTILDHFGQGSIEISDSSEFSEAALLGLNCDKASFYLQWTPTWDPIKSIQQTALWYKEYYRGSSMTEYTLRQANEFFSNLPT